MNKRLFKIYYEMKRRCYNPTSSSYPNYGERGIKVCKEWRDSFESFEKWALENGYVDTLTIERKDVNGDYSPDNCSWIPRSLQNRNRRNTHWVIKDGEKRTLTEISKEMHIDRESFREYEKRFGSAERALNYIENRREPYGRCIRTLTYKGETKSVLEWSKIFNVNPKTIQTRIEKFGWSVEDALTKSAQKTVISYNGETHSLKEWSCLLNIDYETLRGRFYGGWDTEKMLTTPKQR